MIPINKTVENDLRKLEELSNQSILEYRKKALSEKCTKSKW